MKKLFTNLTFWVLVAITLGVVAGHYFPEFVQQRILAAEFKTRFLNQEFSIKPSLSEVLMGTFISVIKLFILPIIFLTITLGIVSMGDLKKVGRVGLKALIYFEVVTTFALLAGVAIAFIVKPGHGIDTSAVKQGDISRYTKGDGFSWLKFLEDNATLQALILALVCGIVLSFMKNRDVIIKPLKKISTVIFRGLHFVMLLAPIGAFGGMAYMVSTYGIDTLLPMFKLLGTMYATMAVFIFVVLYYILRMYRVSVFRFLKYIREELLIVLGTSSSESSLPNLMEKLERMGCSKSVVGLVVPTGYSFNLDGTTIYLSMSMIFLAQVYDVHLSLSQVASIIGILMLTSKGAAGVAGSGFAVLASTLVTIRVIPIEGLALLVGIDRFMSEGRAITNFIGNGVATIWLANNEKEFDREKMEIAFSTVRKTEDIGEDNINASTMNH
ncbi:MAG: cation:dicarboxylase symporter family transporter [Chitinophagaceae bacterium]|nr:MAG: cation:dicarboxylase symporter family transporter [Chitinophagaceae bacterium]